MMSEMDGGEAKLMLAAKLLRLGHNYYYYYLAFGKTQHNLVGFDFRGDTCTYINLCLCLFFIA
jgi:hypothetical protein